MKRIFSVLLTLTILCSFSVVGLAASMPTSSVGTVTVTPAASYSVPTGLMDYTKTLTATASASASLADSYGAGNVIDGDTSSFWHSANKTGDYLVVDLGKKVKISNVQWFFKTGRATSYSGVNLAYSTDGVDYTPLMSCNIDINDYPDQNGYWVDVALATETEIQYIKYTGSTAYHPVAFEIKALGANNDPRYVLPNGVTDKTQLNGLEYVYDRAASTATPSYITDNAIDYTKEAEATATAANSYANGHYGVLNVLSTVVQNKWLGSDNNGKTKEFIVDLGQVANVDYVEWYTPSSGADAAQAYNCTLAYSTDGSDYTTFYKREGKPAADSWTEMKFKNAVPVRYIKYTCLGNSAYGAAWNIKVWGDAAADGSEEYRTLTGLAQSAQLGNNHLIYGYDGNYSTYYVSGSTTGIPFARFRLDKVSRIDKIRIAPYDNTNGDHYNSLGDFAVYGYNSNNELYLLAKVDGQTLKVNQLNDLDVTCDREFQDIFIVKTNDNKADGALAFTEIKVVEDTSVNTTVSLYKKDSIGTLTVTPQGGNATTYTVYDGTPVENVTAAGKYETVCTYKNNDTEKGCFVHVLMGSFGAGGKLTEYAVPTKTGAKSGEEYYIAPNASGIFAKEYTITNAIAAIKAVITSRYNSANVPLMGGDIVGALDVNVN